jgi:hypothetical protein
MSVDWPTLLRQISEHLLESTRDDEDAREMTWLQAARDEPGRAAEEAETRTRTRWLGFPGASEEDIAARERELGVTLPEDYRAFLRASNGFLSMNGFPHGISTLSPVQRIGWLRDLDNGRLRAYDEEFGGRDDDDIPDEWYVRQEEFARTLLIGDSDGNECILLRPPGPGVQFPNWNQWEVWMYDTEAGFEILDDSPHTFLDFMSRGLNVRSPSQGYGLLALIDETRPSAAALRERIDALDVDALVELLADLVDAAAEVRVKWEGPVDPSLGRGGDCWSEDWTEDVVDWIVAQGTEVWLAARGASDEALLELGRAYDAEQARGGRWDEPTPPLRGLIHAAYARLKGDGLAIFDHLERVLAAR